MRRASAVPNLILKLSFDISTAEARRLSQIFKFGAAEQLRSTRSAVLHDSGTAAIQTSCLCRVEPNG